MVNGVRSKTRRLSGIQREGEGARRRRLVLASAAARSVSVESMDVLLRLMLFLVKESACAGLSAVVDDDSAVADGGDTSVEATMLGDGGETSGAVTTEAGPALVPASDVAAVLAAFTGRVMHRFACLLRLDATPNRRPHVSHA